MRVISGKFKGRTLTPPKSDKVRPTTDRVKESLFNILTNRGVVKDCNVLDLFCGSGALGIECISRGAGNVTFVDKEHSSIELTKSNLSKVMSNATTDNQNNKASSQMQIQTYSQSPNPNRLQNQLQTQKTNSSDNKMENETNSIENIQNEFGFATKCMDFASAIKLFAQNNQKFDLILLDPPYNKNIEIHAIDIIVEYNILNQDGIIATEVDKKTDLTQVCAKHNLASKEYKMGNTKLVIISI